MIKFVINNDEEKRINAWVDEQDKIVAKRQGNKRPYYGAIGGALTYSFTPTSMGMIIKVVHCTGVELDITDYGSW